MLATGVVYGMKRRDRTADAAHLVREEHADRLGPDPHHVIDGIVIRNWHARLRSGSNDNATAALAVCPATSSWRIFYTARLCSRLDPSRCASKAAATLRTRKRELSATESDAPLNATTPSETKSLSRGAERSMASGAKPCRAQI